MNDDNRPIKPYKPRSTIQEIDLHESWMGWIMCMILAFFLGFFWLPHK